MESSECFDHFGHTDFRPDSQGRIKNNSCPIKHCSTDLIQIPYYRSEAPFCPAHGLRLHSNTFGYWNGPNHLDEARLRNFQFGRELAKPLALHSGKAESHRLGHETSEDALTWNIFVALWQARKL